MRNQEFTPGQEVAVNGKPGYWIVVGVGTNSLGYTVYDLEQGPYSDLNGVSGGCLTAA